MSRCGKPLAVWAGDCRARAMDAVEVDVDGANARPVDVTENGRDDRLGRQRLKR